MIRRSMQYSLLAVILAIAGPASAQVRIMRTDTTGTRIRITGDVTRLPELGALITGSQDVLKVEHVMPPANRPAAYAGVDLQAGDIVLIMNGKRVKRPKEIDQIYGALPVGSEIKLGLQRGSEMLIASYPKADAKDLPQVKMIVRTDSTGGPSGGKSIIIRKSR